MLFLKLIAIFTLLCVFSIASDAEDCDLEVEAASGSVVNQGFPTPYANDLDCYYTIRTPDNTAVTLEILYLDLEDGPDYIEIYDGLTTDSELLGTYTGMIRNSSYIYATSNEAMIHFHTDYSITYTGFDVYFFSRDLPTGGCPNDLYTGDLGVILSPNFSNTYPKNLDCNYNITTSSGTQVNLHVNLIDIVESTDCNNDYVEIYDGPSNTSMELARFCGQGPINGIFGSTNQLLVLFHSGSSNNNHTGFNITYSTDPCTGPSEFTGDYGTVSSPGYPLFDYPNNADCSYTVTTPSSSHVFIRISYINLESGGANCPYDYVKIYDGVEESDNVLGTFCSTGMFDDIEASSNEVLIKFHSDDSIAYAGFSITYSATYV